MLLLRCECESIGRWIRRQGIWFKDDGVGGEDVGCVYRVRWEGGSRCIAP